MLSSHHLPLQETEIEKTKFLNSTSTLSGSIMKYSFVSTFVFVLISISIKVSFASEVFAHCDKNDNIDCNGSQQSGTIDESLNDLDQEDPRLIEEIRKRLLPIPSADKPYNFSSDVLDLKGQFNQAELVSELFKNQKDGFYIEAGAFDGEVFSNSLYYELKLGWKGLLVEPNPDPLADLIRKNRKAQIFGHCFSSKKTPEVVDFDAAGLFGGIIHNDRKPGDTKADPRELRNRPKDFKPKYPYHRRTIRVQCFPVYSILLAMGNPTVDLFSLDIEGAEYPVLQTIPWDKVNIRLLIIEVNHAGEIFEGNRFQIRKLLKDNGYKISQGTDIDDIYIKRKF